MSFIPNAGGAGKATSKDEIIKLLQNQVAQQNMTELVQTMHEGCFKKCVPQPGSSMSKQETACVAQCVQKYMGVLDVVSKQWNQSINEMKSKQGGSMFG